MKSYLKYISKHIILVIFLIVALIVLNIFVFIATFNGVVSKDYGDFSPKNMLSIVSENCSKASINDVGIQQLSANNIWAAFIDKEGKSTWTVNVPSDFPKKFSLNDVAIFSKGYLLDYPVFIETNKDGMIILGYPKDSYFKLTNNFFSTMALKKLPMFLLITLLVDCLFIFMIYYRSKKKIKRNIEPIMNGIESLSKGESTSVDVSGDLKDIADGINQASYIITHQNVARANWIAGVSHDIRTPLSIILGYSDRIKTAAIDDSHIRNYSEIIESNCIQIKHLVSDLNLVSMLEYDMQPLQIEEVRLSKLVRSFVADTLNRGLAEQYALNFEISNDAEPLSIECDSRLINRALSNLVNNCVKHNPDGCNIDITLSTQDEYIKLSVYDDGVGLSEEQRKELEKPHYMNALDDRLDLRHGLGTILVKQIVQAHHGRIETPVTEKGFKIELCFLLNS